jgi:isocitrate dehydrogenase (NAD+)
MPKQRITEFLGDGVGEELSKAVHRLVEVLPVSVEFVPVDLSLHNRQTRGAPLFQEAYKAIRETRFALKYPTITADESPNAVLRRMCKFSVIHRPVYTIPGVPRNFKPELDVDIVRVATGGTYEDPGRMIGDSGAVSVRITEREPVVQAAVFAFELGRKHRKSVTSSSKYTIQRATDGLFEQIVEEIHTKAYADVKHKKELFDALLAKLIMKPADFEIMVLPNEYGDFLSDLACGLAGSLGLGASGSYSFTQYYGVDLAMFDPTHGTAPDIAGKNKVNPTAMFLALGQLLSTVGESAGAHIRDQTIKMLGDGVLTGDLGGKASTTEFTEELCKRLKQSLKAER